jgi:hypothetical protein
MQLIESAANATKSCKVARAVLCPICLERRSYVVSTEVLMGSPSWEVTRALQGQR